MTKEQECCRGTRKQGILFDNFYRFMQGYIDYVSLMILLGKFLKYCFNFSCLFIKLYLTNIKQYVQLNNIKCSSTLNFESAVLLLILITFIIVLSIILFYLRTILL